MHKNVTNAPSLLALDWGTSSLRAYLLARDGRVLATRSEPWGIMRVPNGAFAAAFDAVTAEWRMQWPGLNGIAAGMIGSARGWVETPYCPAPAGVDELASSLVEVADATLSIVPGIAQLSTRPDVMRGEETQIAGALELQPALTARSLLVLPGTHSKWVHVRDGKVHEFTTYMTGELFAVLREHSILGRFAKEGEAVSHSAAGDPYSRGVLAAQHSDRGVAPLLFSARSLVLTNQLDSDDSLEYLSGLLIGEEIRCGLMEADRPSAVIGDAALCARYVEALRIFGVQDVPIVDGAAHTGLWSIARRAGLFTGTDA